jgi:hypothetical protein
MTTPTTFADLVKELLKIINYIIPAIIAVLFLVIIWKVFDAWVLNADDESKRTEGKQLAVTAVIVLVVIASAWGIIRLLRSSIFGI